MPKICHGNKNPDITSYIKSHIENVCGKMNQRLSILRRLKDKMPQVKLRIIAGAIFTSVARYGITVYSKPQSEMSEPLF